ncbi:hypothetical protein ACNO7T_15760 [Vibrio campbellii]
MEKVKVSELPPVYGTTNKEYIHVTQNGYSHKALAVFVDDNNQCMLPPESELYTAFLGVENSLVLSEGAHIIQRDPYTGNFNNITDQIVNLQANYQELLQRVEALENNHETT